MQIEKGLVSQMRDGAGLIADVYLPDPAGSHPVILIRTPYDRTAPRIQRKGGFYASHGFAVVIQDVRGTGASPGKESFYPWLADGSDGPDTMRWVEGQRWCNGRIGTLGGSYLASDQWLAAPDAPDSLRCMVTCVGPYSFRSGYYHGGAHYLYVTLPYALMMAGKLDLAAGRESVLADLNRRFHHLPLCDADLADGRHNPMFQDMLRKPPGDPYWEQMDGLREPRRMRAPVLQMEGWFDAYGLQAFRAHDIVRRKAGTAAAREHSRILVGAWGHDRTGECFGEMDFGPNVGIDLYAYELQWFQHWLMDRETPIVAQPPIRVFTMGVNSWRDFTSWPPEDASETRLYLRSRGHANTRSGDGALDNGKPSGGEPPDQFTYDPLDPVLSMGGNHSADFIGYPAGPLDQSLNEDRKDVLVYTSSILETPLEIAGPVELELYAASTAPDTDFTAKLVDVYPDTTPLCLSEGIVRASRRHDDQESPALEPAAVEKFDIALFDISHRFLPGHRMRLEISSSNFPRFSRNLNTGADSHTTSETRVADQTVHHSEGFPSALRVWFRPSQEVDM